MCTDLIDRANIITCKTLKSQHTFQLGQFRCDDMYKSSQPNTECAYYYAKERHTECAYYY